MPTDGRRVSGPGPTDQQRAALETRGTSVAVSAGAGCGKTFVLTERFLAELEPDSAIKCGRRPKLGQVVAITFTERAAREMRERIRSACNLRLNDCADEEVDHWSELIRELDSARISTIHSFCASLLRAHAVEARLDPRFRVLDGVQASTLLYGVLDDVLRARLADRCEAAISLIANFGLDRVRAMTARLLAARHEIDWTAWLNESAEGLVSRWEEFFRSDTLPRLLARLGKSEAALAVLEIARRRPSDHARMQERFAALVELLAPPAEPQATDGPGFLAALDAIDEAARVRGGGTKKNWTDENDYECFKNAATRLREETKKLRKRASFDAAAALPVAAASLQAMELAADAAEQYDRRKRELAVLDFSDLMIHAARLLSDPEADGLRKRLAAQIRLLLVDEFQDTDPLQVALVKAICNNEHLRGKLFVVGDYKQSIYRFRGADPHVFRHLRDELPAAGRLPLSLNFRSQPAVLEFVNSLFADELGPFYEPLSAARPQIGPTPAVEFIWAGEASDERVADDGDTSDRRPSPADGRNDGMGRSERLRRREAQWIARRIRSMLDSGEKIVWDETAAAPALRQPRPGDFALLFRAMTNVEYYENALRQYGIDYYLVGGRAFYAQQEIYDVLNLLRTLDSRCDEVSLVGVLRSPMFCLHDETIFWLARHERGLAGGLFADELPAEIGDEQRRQVGFAAATIRQLRAVKDRLPVARLIQTALDLTGYDAVVLAEFLGDRKLANLYKLIEQARSFDQSGVFSLPEFITQLAEFVARQPDEPLAATCPESTDVVKLMSIHQSKGLEFPVVVVPDLDRPRRVQGPPIAFTSQLGPMLKNAEATTGYDLFMAAEDDEDLAESSRLLYVAATRAADRLILSAGVDRPGKTTGPWTKLLAKRFDPLTGRRRIGKCERDAAEESPNASSSNASMPSDVPLVSVTATRLEIHTEPTDIRLHRDLSKIVTKAGQWPPTAPVADRNI